jgi:hypothetical protein
MYLATVSKTENNCFDDWIPASTPSYMSDATAPTTKNIVAVFHIENMYQIF